MLADDAIECVTDADVTKLKEALIAWFDTRTIINKGKIANLEQGNLKYRKDKEIHSYYNRIKIILEEAGGQDFQTKNPP